MRILRDCTKGSMCEPRYDFCYLDGAHQWEPDALALLLATKLLRPGAWMMVDDLNLRLRGCHDGWEASYGDRSDEELDTPQVGMAFDLLAKAHPDLEHFMLSNSGHIGWARKVGPAPPIWFPDGVVCGAIACAWCEARDGAAIEWHMPLMDGVSVEEHGSSALIRSTVMDPSAVIRNPIAKNPIAAGREIDFVSLRIRLLMPAMATLQLFWVGQNDEYFHEERSARCGVRALGDAQDLAFRLRGPANARTIRFFRLDPADGPCTMLLERITVGGR
jgi:hypothetical protein